MPSIVFLLASGESRIVDVAVGTTVMAAAVKHGIDGIIGECGGSCMCATCHIYVEDGFLALLPAVQEVEDAVLEDTNSDRRPNSRLGCQITMTAELDGLTVRVPRR